MKTSTLDQIESKNQRLSKPSNSLSFNVLAAWFVCFMALILSIYVRDLATDVFGWHQNTGKLLKAISMSAIVVLGVMILRNKSDRNNPVSIGLSAPLKGFSLFMLGCGLLLIPLIICLLATSTMGWAVLKFNFDAAYLNPLILGFVIVFLFEALPEELAFRGFIYSNLNVKFARWKSGLITVGLFILLPVFLTPVQKYVLGMHNVSVGGSSSITISYVITMFMFGSFVQYLRILTGSIWTGVGFHLFFVYINRLIGLEATDLIQFTEMTDETGMQIVFISCLLLMFLSLILYPKITGNSLGWKSVDNQNNDGYKQ